MPIRKARNEPRRMSRDEWLQNSLDHLARHGPTHLRIDELSKALGVTKGSFYHHFNDRAEWLREIAEYWDERSTRVIVSRVLAVEGSAEDRLWALMVAIDDTDAARYEIAIRGWAAREPSISQMVERVDAFRLGVARELFSDLGFSGDQLEARATTFKATMEYKNMGFDEKSQASKERYMRALFDFFTERDDAVTVTRGY